MATKVTILFQLTTAPVASGQTPRTAGWSESLYLVSESPVDSIRRIVDDYCNARAGLLTKGASIIGQRYQLVDPVRGANVVSRTWPGIGGPATTPTDPTQDYPSLCAYFKAATSVINKSRPTFLRGLPDAYVLGGEWYGGSQGSGVTRGDTALNALLAQLNGFSHRYRTVSATPLVVFSISGAGSVVFTAPHGLLVGAIIRAYRMQDSFGNPVTGNFRVKTVTDTFTVIVEPWETDRIVLESGQFRQVTYAYATITVPLDRRPTPRIISRKPGRPFGAFRGRASRRRRSPR